MSVNITKTTLLAVVLLFSYPQLAGQKLETQEPENQEKERRKFITGNNKRGQYHSVGLSVGATNYFGDLSPTSNESTANINFTQASFSAFYFFHFESRFSLKAEFTYAMLRGGDSDSPSNNNTSVVRNPRNLSFRNQVKELAITGGIDLVREYGKTKTSNSFIPYLYAGVAFILHNPQAQVPQRNLFGAYMPQAGDWVDLQPLGTEGQYASLQKGDVNYGIEPYSLFNVGILAGFGIRLRLSDNIDAWLDAGFRYTFTDYLDDVSQNYVDLGVFGDNELAKSLSYRNGEVSPFSPTIPINYIGRDGKPYIVEQNHGYESQLSARGNPNTNDWYIITSLKISYTIGNTRKPKHL